jgi:NAD(P)-dependent dehydrogenase (short-subunit alcohol dehydrogenase family)
MSDKTEKWMKENVPDLKGKRIVVTGANSGLGFVLSRIFAGKGAELTMACRNLTKGEDALKKIKEFYPDSDVKIAVLDLADLSSVHSFIDSFSKNNKSLDILCNNAGVMAIPEMRTKDDFEMQFGTNHLGHFALSLGLLPLLNEARSGRIVNTSSMAARMGIMDFDNLNAEKKYDKWKAYGQSKLANLLFTFELNKRLQQAGSNVSVYSSHPGYSSTNLMTRGPELEGSTIKIKFMSLANFLIATKPELGALPTVYAATSANVEPGAFYGPHSFGLWGFPDLNSIPDKGKDPVTATRLWDVSEKLTGINLS